jgi:hypothetical protein
MSEKRIKAKNLTAQLQYRGRGNPPTTHPTSAISNCIPGLEMDFRNVWRRFLEGIELHEGWHMVVAADREELQFLTKGWQLISIFDMQMMAPVSGPLYVGGPDVPLPDAKDWDNLWPLEWSNALALVLHQHAGQLVPCKFQNSTQVDQTVVIQLRVRPFFESAPAAKGESAQQPVIARDLLQPGELSQSLCSPWQNDYRACGCFYWAATRPDFVNVRATVTGTSTGNNWLQRDLTPDTAPLYIAGDDPALLSYDDLYRRWTEMLRFVFGGRVEREQK